jgi:3-phosphoshikimate 1-carboxyvinyltransferase
MKLVVSPGRPLMGIVSLPGDKSISHRAALFASLAEGESHIQNFLIAGVTRAMLQALEELEVTWSLQDTTLTIQGQGIMKRDIFSNPVNLYCGNSGTTMRLLAGGIAACGIPAILDGSSGLRRRPMKRIVEPLQAMGVPIQASPGYTAPLQIAARPQGPRLRPINYTLPIASAQVKSCLLLAALGADGPTVLREPGPSRDHTEIMLRSMGVSIIKDQQPTGDPGEIYYQTRISPPASLRLSPLNILIPGDFSSAAFLIVAATITPGSEINLIGLGLNPTRTGLLDALQSMGADIQVTNKRESHGEPLGDLLVRYAPLRGTRISGSLVIRAIDEIPVLAIAAAFARGKTIVSQADELRHKESNRIGDLSRELHQLGIEIEETQDGFIINGGQDLRGGTVTPHGDHRLAMALAIAGLAARDTIIIDGAEIISESFPEFSASLRDLGAAMHIEQ